MTLPIWQSIRETLTREIMEGRFAQGARLPTEADLANRFAVNRHTVRRALSAMRDEGLVRSRRGAGVFVTARTIDYPVGARTRFTQPLRARGHQGSRTVLRLDEQNATEPDAKLLEIAQGDPVVVMETLGLIDGTPVTHAQGLFPAERIPGIADALRTASGSATAAFSACGIDDYRRAWTRITAKRAGAPLARHLQIADGAPLIRTRSLNVDPQGRPLELGRTHFCADRVELLVEDGETG